jgi:two-component system chemotaxis sensor kinase CheA
MPDTLHNELLPQRISDLLSRVACELVLTGQDDDVTPAITSALTEIHTLLQSGALDGIDAVRTVLIQALACRTAAALAPTLEALTQRWESWRLAEQLLADTAPAAPAVVDATPAGPVHDEAMDAELSMLQADPELAGMFLAEALDHLSSIEAIALQLETSPGDRHLLNEMFRPFHTVKGNAGALAITSVQELAHAVENLLDAARSGQHDFGPSGIDLVLQSVDLLSAMLRDLGSRLAGQPAQSRRRERDTLIAALEHLLAHGEPAAGAAPTATAVAAADAATEARVARADTQADGSGMPRQRAEDMPGQTSVKVDTRKLDNLVDMVGELVIVQSIIHQDPALRVLEERLARNLAQLRRITTDLQRTAMSMRLVPIRQTFQKMARLVRDLSRKSGKPVDLVVSGEETELDRRVVEDINDPLMHMVRNSLDHGIEPADVRVARGKKATARLSLSAYHQGGHVVIDITDDGNGLNAERILAKAVAQGLVDKHANLSPAEIHHLIFRPGFSTAEKVTEISGRGVGMDVVRRNIEALRGRIEIDTTPGQGTKFTIRLPLTLAIVDGLILGVGAQRFVLPTFAICESLRPLPEQVHEIQGQPRMVRVRDTLMPLVRLADLFGIADAVQDASAGTLVVIEDANRRVALQVDQLLGKQEVVIKSLGAALKKVPGVAGGAILGDGRVGLILDAHGLLELKLGTSAAA